MQYNNLKIYFVYICNNVNLSHDSSNFSHLLYVKLGLKSE